MRISTKEIVFSKEDLERLREDAINSMSQDLINLYDTLLFRIWQCENPEKSLGS